ncbi:serine hydrolase domain-containing protein [Pseudokordiimonas caeni]|uniref:serine hydrolase domain-containing protein n=1 Tax=Pseudokordiimonas caeni TaxID=2997908 RepID=UPI0028122757|nr:serine hydrolase domain-containing protein [Pseudokordiimonas caeni]
MRLVRFILLFLWAPVAASAATLEGLPNAAPASAGMSAEALAAIKPHFEAYVDEGKLGGLATLVSRNGKIVHFETYGDRDVAAGDPIRADTIYRIYSMTKPITGVALMMLYEEGKFRLDDPVEKYIPAFRNARVFVSKDETGKVTTEPANRPVTMLDMMRHTAGLTYGVFGDTPVDQMYKDSGLFRPDTFPKDGDNFALWAERLATQPLLYQPGEKWVYSLAVDVQGYLVELLSGMPFEDFLQKRLFGPLGMKDTGFRVTADKLDRFAEIYTREEGKDGVVPARGGLLQDFTAEPPFPSGGGGLVSTISDYWRFAQMMLNGGELDGVRVLKPETVALMTENHLPPAIPSISDVGQEVGFGLDFAVKGGEFYWSGMANTFFWVDRDHDVVAIVMTNYVPFGAYPIRAEFHDMVTAAITR